MAALREVSDVSHTHHYHISIRATVWAIALIILAMTLLYPVLNFPPTFGTYASDSYFHGIGLSMAALATCLIIIVFDLQRHEPAIDFPLHYRALLTSVLAAASSVFFLTPFLSSIPQIPTVLFTLAALFAIDITGAAFIELLFLPRKLGKTYSLERLQTKPFPQRYLLMFAYKSSDFRTYSRVGAAYWLVLAGLASLFIGEIIGLVLLWISLFGPGFLAPYVQSLGGLGSTQQTILDPHSHGVAVAIIAIVAGLVVERFQVLRGSGWKKNLSGLGMWVGVIGIVLLTLVYLAGALVGYSPPTLFQGGPNGINGMAGDDALITLVFLGAVLALLPLALTKFRGAGSWRDAIRLALMFSLLMWLVANALAGFFIEFNESSFSTTLVANDEAFSQFQPMFGIFFLTIIAMVLLSADIYGEKAGERKNAGWLAFAGTAIATAGGLGWTFINPYTNSIEFWAYIGGVALMCLSILLSILMIKKAKVQRVRIVKR